MTKKDYEAIAFAIKNSPADRDLFIDMIVDLCADSNAQFNETLFRKASGQVESPCGCWIFTHEGEEAQSWNTGTLCHYREGHPISQPPNRIRHMTEEAYWQGHDDEPQKVCQNSCSGDTCVACGCCECYHEGDCSLVNEGDVQ
jgi:hypothetical protein